MQLSRNLAAAAAMSMPPAPTPHHEPTSEPTKSEESPPPTGSPTFEILGDNVCTYAPDHKCYPSTDGRPKCCEKPDTSDCLSDVDYPCEKEPDTKKPTRKPTRKPARDPTRKPTRKPTSKPARDPTRKPTTERRYNSDSSLSVCMPNEAEVNVQHGGEMFTFKWNETSYGRCVDNTYNTYSYGAYNNIPSYEECAKTCLDRMDQVLLLEDQRLGSMSFRGIDYICESRGSMNANPDKYYFEGECRCLFDKGTLDHLSWKDDSFDSIHPDDLGVGPVNSILTLTPISTQAVYTEFDISYVRDVEHVRDVEQTTLCGAIVNRYNIKEQGVTAVY